MDIRIENKNVFYVSGYAIDTSEASLETDCAMLREKYEGILRPVSNHLYFVAWAAKDGTMTYLLGIETTSQVPATEGATCVEVPANCFAVAVVPQGASILAMWHEFFGAFETETSALGGAAIDIDYRFYLESFAENGVCELWIPVKK